MNLNFHGQVELRRSPQGFAQNFLLDLELALVAGVLVVAAPALREVWTSGLDAFWRRFDDSVDTRPGEAGFLFGQRSFDFFPSEDKWNENGLAAAARVGRQAGQAVAAIDEFFNRE